MEKQCELGNRHSNSHCLGIDGLDVIKDTLKESSKLNTDSLFLSKYVLILFHQCYSVQKLYFLCLSTLKLSFDTFLSKTDEDDDDDDDCCITNYSNMVIMIDFKNKNICI